jgi:hypothetical protein
MRVSRRNLSQRRRPAGSVAFDFEFPGNANLPIGALLPQRSAFVAQPCPPQEALLAVRGCR